MKRPWLGDHEAVVSCLILKFVVPLCRFFWPNLHSEKGDIYGGREIRDLEQIGSRVWAGDS